MKVVADQGGAEVQKNSSAVIPLSEGDESFSALNLSSAAFENYHAQVFHAWLRLDGDGRRVALRDRYIFFSVACCAGAHLGSLLKVDFDKASEFVRALMQEVSHLAQDKAGYSENWFRGLEQLAGALADLNYLPEARSVVAIGIHTGVAKFPRIAQSLSVHAAYLDSLAGRKEKAAKVALRLVHKPFLLPSRRELPKLYLRLMYVLSSSNHIEEYRSILWKGVSSVHASGELRDKFASQIVKTYRGAFRALLHTEVSLLYRVPFLLANVSRIIAAIPVLSAARFHLPFRALHLASLYFVDYVSFAIPGASRGMGTSKPSVPRGVWGAMTGAGPRETKRILVTRAMGGIGDLLMMTPGLQALSLKWPESQVDFAIPKSFHPIFEGLSTVRLLDINEDEIDLGNYQRWINLTDCPAGRMEARQYPNVRRNRIEIFAKAMGSSRRRLRRMAGFLPRYQLAQGEKEWALDYLRQVNPEGLPIIGIQPFSADTYKNWPHMEELAHELARDHFVLIFHHEEIPGYNGPRIHKVLAPLRKSAALLFACHRLVAVDSSFVHLSAALGVKAVALFGPTSGRVFCRYYPNVRYLTPQKSEFPCVPCWRNEHKPCHLTNGRESICLRTVSVEQVIAALDGDERHWRSSTSMWGDLKAWVLYGRG